MTNQFEFENRIVLATLNALIGTITPYVTAVSVKVDEAAETADYFFALKERDPILEELMDDFPTEIGTLTDDAVYVSVNYWVGERWYDNWPGREHRLIFGLYER